MKAHQQGRIVLASSRLDAPTRDGEMLEIEGQDGAPPYLVRWADGQLCPAPDSVQRVEAEDEPIALADVILLSDARARHSST